VIGRAPARLLITAHTHLLLVGFVLMLIMGVATWMFPRPGVGNTRYRPGTAEAVYWIVAIGTTIRAVAEILSANGAVALRPLVALGGFLQASGAVLFVVNIWWRVRMPAAAGR
jgi:cbb3-type cytochrome oxidase subunit 1